MTREKWSKEKILSQINELHTNNFPLNAISIMEKDIKLYGAARTHFGSWKNAIEAAGLNYAEINHKLKEVTWSKELIASEIQKIASEGGDLRSDSVQKNYTKLHSAAQRYFDSWKDAIEYAGFNYSSIKKIKWNNESVIMNILDLYNAGKDISSSAMQKTEMPLFQAGCRLFGSWANAVNASGIDYKNIKKQLEWDEKTILEKINELYELDGKCSVSNVLKDNASLYQAAKRHFHDKSWEYIVQKARENINN